ncbi:MAG: saccharopine dehydrogenase NADP-binding domain-containing protein [Candidatus Binatia bacterium]|nr:saccharopine dehydrogenase NADP-binding domain-containing protein [Candidatus Binatia bacterium]
MEQRGITVFGATGYTGRLVVAELMARGARPLLAGRNAQKLAALAREHGGLPTMVADVARPQSLAAVAERSRVMVNCAGPFVDLGEPVVDAAIAARAHYLDTTGEQPFIRAVQERDAKAREAGVAVVPAHAFEIALSDCGAAVLARGYRDVASIEVVYATRFHASQGTKRSVLRMLGAEGFGYEEGKVVRQPPARYHRAVELPEGWGVLEAVSFPSAEILTIPRHVRTRAVRTYLALPKLVALGALWLVPPVRVLAKTPLVRIAERLLGSETSGPDPAVRAADRFLICVEIRGVSRGEARRETLVITGRDPYGITAAVAAQGALRMAAEGYNRSGVLAPAQAFDPEAVLADCAAFDVVWKKLA